MVLINLVLIAIGLSMDTFSLSLAYGMILKEKNIIAKISLSVGIFHFFMPIIGNKIGECLLSIIKINPEIVEAFVFFSLALELFISIFKKEELNELNSILSIITFSLAVSIDSFIVGIGLDGITNNTYFASLIFMVISFIFTFLGLNFGKKIKKIIGNKAEVLGIIILLLLSIKYILNVI